MLSHTSASHSTACLLYTTMEEHEANTVSCAMMLIVQKVQCCRSGNKKCLYTTLAVYFIYQQMTLALPCWVSVPHHFYVLRLWASATIPTLLPGKWSVIKAASKSFSELLLSYHLTQAAPKYQYSFFPPAHLLC